MSPWFTYCTADIEDTFLSKLSTVIDSKLAQGRSSALLVAARRMCSFAEAPAKAGLPVVLLHLAGHLLCVVRLDRIVGRSRYQDAHCEENSKHEIEIPTRDDRA